MRVLTFSKWYDLYESDIEDMSDTEATEAYQEYLDSRVDFLTD